MTDDLHAVLLGPRENHHNPALGEALAKQKKIPYHDAAHVVRECWGIPLEAVDKSTATEFVRRLADVKITARCVSQTTFTPLPAVETIKSLAFKDTRIAVAVPTPVVLQLKEITILAAAGVKTESTTTVHIKEGPNSIQKAVNIAITAATMIPVNVGPKKKEYDKVERHSDISFYLDLIALKAGRRFRIDINKFDFSFLKAEKLYDGIGNLRLLLKRLSEKIPDALTNRGFDLITKGEPLHSCPYESLSDLEKEERWLSALHRAS